MRGEGKERKKEIFLKWKKKKKEKEEEEEEKEEKEEKKQTLYLFPVLDCAFYMFW